MDEYPNTTETQRDICAHYGHLLNSTGGNPPLELLNDTHNESLASTNILRFVLSVAVLAQVALIEQLEEEGLLVRPV